MSNRGHAGYKLLPHMTDAYVEVRAQTLNAAFEEAAFAMFDIMTDPTAIEREFMDQFEITSHDEVSLLHDWLEELLVRFDVDGKVYSRFDVKKIEARDGDMRLVGEAQGGLFRRGKHPAKVEVKAVTFHRMEVSRTSRGFVVRFILDL